MADHFRQRVEAFLEGVGEAVVHGAQRLGRDLGRGQVGRSFQADREGMQARPPGFGLVVVLDAAGGRSARRTAATSDESRPPDSSTP